MLTKLTKQQQKDLIKVMDRLPPVTNLFFMTATKDQLEHFHWERFSWQLIGLGLKAYFSGKSIPKVLRKEIGKEPPLYLIQNINRWLQFYELLNFGWEEIELAAKKFSISLPSESPGGAIAFVLEQLSIYQCSECLLPYYTISPQTFYRDYKNWQKIKQKKQTSKPLTNPEEKTLKRLTKSFKSNPRREFMEGAFFQEFCLDVWSRSKNRIIKTKLKKYLKTVAEYQEEVTKPLHPRHRRKGHGWKKGKRLVGKQGGYS